MKTASSAYYYSLPNDAPPRPGNATPTRRKDAQLSPSPRKTIENASSSISTAVVTSVNSAKKIKDRARSFVPKSFLSAPPVPDRTVKKGGSDEVTPVIFYPDEDTIMKDADGAIALIDPFSLEDSEGLVDKKETQEDSFSPTSVVPIRLFHGVRSSSSEVAYFDFAAAKDDDTEESDRFGEMVSFDRPIFDNDFKGSEEDTSIDLSEAIKSINDPGSKAFLASIRAGKEADGDSSEAWEDTKLPAWDGRFKRSARYTMCDWDPKNDDAGPSTSPRSLKTE